MFPIIKIVIIILLLLLQLLSLLASLLLSYQSSVKRNSTICKWLDIRKTGKGWISNRPHHRKINQAQQRRFDPRWLQLTTTSRRRCTGGPKK